MASISVWKPVQEAKEENRHELLIAGKDLEKGLSLLDGKLDAGIFNLLQLNYLRLSSSSLADIPVDIKNLKNLSNLELQNNKLVSLPKEIGSLSKLKLLDVSGNQIQALPEELSKLSSLHSLNARNNLIEQLVTFENCTSLVQLDIQFNKISSIEVLCYENLHILAELHASNNNIKEIPVTITSLSNLRILNLEDNSLEDIPGDILHCTKLKEINLKGNPLCDKRFKKLVESDRGYSRTVLDYIRQHFQNAKGKSTGSKQKDKKKKNEDVKEIDKLCDRLKILSANDHLTVKVSSDLKDIRGFIVCCVIQNMDLSGTKMKKFLSIQTKLHDTICDKRVAATIATHDIAKIAGPLTYCVRVPESIEILPLNKSKVVSATEFFKTLQEEADLARKQMKKNTYSGIHKYLYLVEGWSKWPCMVDANGTVISFPPITNSDNTKITPNSVNIFVEVTSSASLKKAKDVMEALILAIFEGGLTRSKTENDKKLFTVEQIRILNEDETFKMVYPSRADLVFGSGSKISVERA